MRRDARPPCFEPVREQRRPICVGECAFCFACSVEMRRIVEPRQMARRMLLSARTGGLDDSKPKKPICSLHTALPRVWISRGRAPGGERLQDHRELYAGL